MTDSPTHPSSTPSTAEGAVKILPTELVRRVIDRLSAAQIFDLAQEMRLAAKRCATESAAIQPAGEAVAWQERDREAAHMPWSKWKFVDQEQHDLVIDANERSARTFDNFDESYVLQEARALCVIPYRAPQDAKAEQAGEYPGWHKVGHLFQHEETGRELFVSEFDLANGFESRNPRLNRVGVLYKPTHAARQSAPIEAGELPTDEQIIQLARKHNLDGSMLHGSRMLNYVLPFARAYGQLCRDTARQSVAAPDSLQMRALAEENRQLTVKMNEWRDKHSESEEARMELLAAFNREVSGDTFMGEPVLSPRPDVSGMVNRFLGWRLPDTFAPDCGISFDGRKDDEWNKNKTWPTGTNLLTAIEAKAMFEHCAAPVQGKASDAEDWQVQSRSGEDSADCWRPVLEWDCGHTVQVDTFKSLADALETLRVMEQAYNEHSFRVHPLATPTAETVKGEGQ